MVNPVLPIQVIPKSPPLNPWVMLEYEIVWGHIDIQYCCCLRTSALPSPTKAARFPAVSEVLVVDVSYL